MTGKTQLTTAPSQDCSQSWRRHTLPLTLGLSVLSTPNTMNSQPLRQGCGPKGPEPDQPREGSSPRLEWRLAAASAVALAEAPTGLRVLAASPRPVPQAAPHPRSQLGPLAHWLG